MPRGVVGIKRKTSLYLPLSAKPGQTPLFTRILLIYLYTLPLVPCCPANREFVRFPNNVKGNQLRTKHQTDLDWVGRIGLSASACIAGQPDPAPPTPGAHERERARPHVLHVMSTVHVSVVEAKVGTSFAITIQGKKCTGIMRGHFLPRI